MKTKSTEMLTRTSEVDLLAGVCRVPFTFSMNVIGSVWMNTAKSPVTRGCAHLRKHLIFTPATCFFLLLSYIGDSNDLKLFVLVLFCWLDFKKLVQDAPGLIGQSKMLLFLNKN